MTGFELPALKCLAGIAGVAISLYQKGGTDDTSFNLGEGYKSVLGQAVGGVFYDLIKAGGSASAEKLKQLLQEELSTDNLNHDLQKAARKAQLVATFFTAQNCLQKLKSADEKSKLAKVGDKLKEITKFISNEEKFFIGLIKYLEEQMKDDNINAFVYQGTLNIEQFEAVFKRFESSVSSDSQNAQANVAESLQEDILYEIEYVGKTKLHFILDNKGLTSLETTIKNGWEEILADVGETNFISLEIYDKWKKKPERYDWFELVCAFFNNEYKSNPRVQAAADKKLLLDISGKLDTFGTLETSISNLISKISAFANQLNRIEDKIDKILERVEKYVAPEVEGKALNLVSLPDRKDKVYGRNDEIEIILEFLGGEITHGAIVSPTCFGKTSLIKKFLHKTTGETCVKPEYEHLFDKVIYVYCYKNQVFQQIIKPFASLEGKELKYTEGDEANFLKLEVFDKLQSNKILLIMDNFESWLTDDEKYLNDDIKVFLNTLFNSDHQIRALFVSQNLAHQEREFSNKVKEIKGIEKKLEKGLDEKSALELVREEGTEDIFKDVSDDELKEFFGKVYYIPQAIQSMIDFVDDEAISFDEFQNEFWEDFENAEDDESRINDETPTELRPTRALLKRQILRSDDARQYLLSLLAFFETIVPKEILLDEANDFDLRELRKALDRLVKNKLVLTETDALQELNENSGKMSDIIYYSLHGFVRETIRRVLPKFEEEHPVTLEKRADRMENENRAICEKKLFEKLLALVECWEKIETYLVNNLKKSDREFNLDWAEFWKALALQESAISLNSRLSRKEISKRAKNSELIYLKLIEKYPNNSSVYYNLGILLTKQDGRSAEAEEAYRTAIELNPNNADAYNNLGILLAKDEQCRDEAKASYNKAIELNPNYAQAYKNLGVLLYNSERYEEAEEKFSKSLEFYPNSMGLNFYLACLNSLARKKEKALVYLERAVDLDSVCKHYARNNSVFDWLRDDERFKRIVGGDDE